ncbi:MAG: hypothetical protein UY31_C0031G0008 [Candidatus Wolfebacteria bacterium GW2011_GWE1_48_7]|uniref:L,D-TPase catalytic domain-containing protein n=2 Tax=Candidatus Wolfeibacteriota TaxID=1752735 RepID=A0A0G1U5R2_9BACT|nr:MAG: hypothetical protein UX70_C0001G0621 [Candidatus Wolfebacteria bacterium GW2011_GWB1_47_1]KKU36844.1 MAG: hypothetical protein UX49_C0007G0003 [Candidatus Wolfebacteria bacterium GW2011_GWC2_46_275]KKU42451.1 MAG: hypothetical protein UX58_C0002G0165 [Candidatus Wolfebacteria bacterium GW2011_GWB2_46_69]KKU54236.1 MAG: hypothetical protein UX76_C0004G0040 [Candidatus Wolfebacteria bacterium GW2011_GWC1_47_103]KKU59604.1 MAG: hypothetical protein UX83_C0003G0019 [Candidatus Wolfebacteria
MNDIIVDPSGIILFANGQYRCAIGKGGYTHDKEEGDGATPFGRFLLREVYFRADRVARPETQLPVFSLCPDDGWCDDISHPQYNTKISLAFDGGHEHLWKDDHIYDVIVVIGYNDDPIIVGKGSAIFMHIARPDYSPTEGCVALVQQDLLSVLRDCVPGTAIRIGL